MTQYAAWLRIDEHRGALATHGRRVIVADTAQEIKEAFGTAEVVELSMVPLAQWLVEGRQLLDVRPQTGPVPMVEELRAGSRWRPTDPQIRPVP